MNSTASLDRRRSLPYLSLFSIIWPNAKVIVDGRDQSSAARREAGRQPLENHPHLGTEEVITISRLDPLLHFCSAFFSSLRDSPRFGIHR